MDMNRREFLNLGAGAFAATLLLVEGFENEAAAKSALQQSVELLNEIDQAIGDNSVIHGTGSIDSYPFFDGQAALVSYEREYGSRTNPEEVERVRGVAMQIKGDNGQPGVAYALRIETEAYGAVGQHDPQTGEIIQRPNHSLGQPKVEYVFVVQGPKELDEFLAYGQPRSSLVRRDKDEVFFGYLEGGQPINDSWAIPPQMHHMINGGRIAAERLADRRP